MYICYVDESGDSGTFNPSDKRGNPFLILCGLVLGHDKVHNLTRAYLANKDRFYPGLTESSYGGNLDRIFGEVKGAELRRAFRACNRRKMRHAIGFIDGCLDVLSRHGAKLIAHCAIKAPYRKNSDEALYGRGIRFIARGFGHFLRERGQTGLIILDSRNPDLDRKTTHAVFTQQHRYSGNPFPDIVEAPVYGNSQNFAMLQLSDVICSAVLFPMLAIAHAGYLKGTGNRHYSCNFHQIKGRYSKKIKNMQLTWEDEAGSRRGIFLQDYTHRGYSAKHLFEPCNWMAYASRVPALPI